MGKKRGEYLAYALVVLAHASVIVLWCLGLFPPFSGFAALVSLIRAGREVVRMHARGFSHETKGLSMKSIAGIFTGFSLLLMLSLFGGIVL